MMNKIKINNRIINLCLILAKFQQLFLVIKIKFKSVKKDYQQNR
jgi:hypothetical protein